jgi:CRP-like cAMP-binding protein
MRRQPTATERMIETMPLFRSCTRRELALVARTFIDQRLPAGTVLLRQGAAGRSFVVIVEGSAVVRSGARTVARLHPGDFAGELALLGRGCHHADVVAETDVVVLECTAAELTGLLHDAPSLTRTMLTTLAARLCAADHALVA